VRISQIWLLITALAIGFAPPALPTGLARLPAGAVQLLAPLPASLRPIGHEYGEASAGLRTFTVFGVARRFGWPIPGRFVLSTQFPDFLIRVPNDRPIAVVDCGRAWTSRAPPLA